MLWSILFRYRYSIFLATVISLLLSFVATLLIEKVYRAEVLIAPVVSTEAEGRFSAFRSQFGGLANLAGLDLGGDNEKFKALAVLESRAFTIQFIKENNLLPVFFADRWDERSSKWEVDNGDEIPSAMDGFRLFDEEIRNVREDRSTGLVTVSIMWKDPNQASAWANLLVDAVNQHLREDALERTEKSVHFLHSELGKTTNLEIRKGIFRLIENQVESAMLINVSDEYAFKILDPAIPPEFDDYIWPNKIRILVLGTILGFGVACVLAMSIGSFELRKRALS